MKKVGVYAGAFKTWTNKDKKSIQQALTEYETVILVHLTPKWVGWHNLPQELQDLVEADKRLNFYATPKTLKEAMSQPFLVNGSNMIVRDIIK